MTLVFCNLWRCVCNMEPKNSIIHENLMNILQKFSDQEMQQVQFDFALSE